jgi:7tm Chemosensory receptor
MILRTIHADLIRCIKLINSIFGFQAMLCIGITFLFTFFTMFSAYKAFTSDDILAFNASLNNLYWCLYYNLFKITMISMCCLTENENSTTAKLIYKLWNRKINCPPMLMQVFGSQVRGQSAKSSCGLFNFDLSLIVLIFSSILTYLIIFIQFDQAQVKALS